MSSEHALQSETVAENLLCSPDTLFHDTGLLFGERLDTLFTSSDSKISGFNRPHVIGLLRIYFCFTLQSGFIFSGFAVEFAGCMWTVAVSGKKKLRIRKYPDTCGRGLRQISVFWEKLGMLATFSFQKCVLLTLAKGGTVLFETHSFVSLNFTVRACKFVDLRSEQTIPKRTVV